MQASGGRRLQRCGSLEEGDRTVRIIGGDDVVSVTRVRAFGTIDACPVKPPSQSGMYDMYSMLLPLEANAQRQQEGHPLPPSGSWSNLFHTGWNTARNFLAPKRPENTPSASPGA